MDIELLRKWCIARKGVTEDVKWSNDLCFCVGGTMFCVTGLEQPRFTVSFKVLDEEFTELIERQGIVPAPYVARYKWVLVESSDALTDDEWDHYIKQSYELIRNKLPKRVRQNL